MHILFVHQNFPAQFGPIGRRLNREHGFHCTFFTNHPPRDVAPDFEVIPYRTLGGATRNTHYFARSFENAVAHAHGVFEACRARTDLRPDLVVAHSGFGSSLFLRERFTCPIVNYFEYFYHPHDSDLDFRPDFPAVERDVLRSYCRNAMLLLDLENCDAGYSPTDWQRSRFPAAYQSKLTTIFDGIDTEIWHRRAEVPRRIANRTVDDDTRIVTYVSRGFESMRGFDIFMRVAKRIYEQSPNVVFAVVGTDRTAYGGDHRHTGGKSFRHYVLEQDDYDLGKFIFTGQLPQGDLADLLSLSDLHIYLTVPFVLSWSLFNALACGATVLASDTAPVRELITHQETGLLAPFFDVDEFTRLALDVLRDPAAFRPLADRGRRLIDNKYSLERSLPQMVSLYKTVLSELDCADG
ncbi:MAG: glycosyltransferase [Pirellulales bacterium]|nr:glycosyltransferase [Pirellulales bacterium]